MIIKSICFKANGYLECKSCFYSAHDNLNETTEYKFTTGINRMIGEIDSGIWAISYLISMHQSIKSNIQLSSPKALVNDEIVTLDELEKYACYMDESCSLFSKKDTVRNMVKHGLKKSGSDKSVDEIRDLFHITDFRFENTLMGVGNEKFKAMAAIAYSYGKQVYCFPWLSRKRFDYYHRNMTDLLNTLESLGGIVIVPIGQ